jgi:hypothetical protein
MSEYENKRTPFEAIMPYTHYGTSKFSKCLI